MSDVSSAVAPAPSIAPSKTRATAAYTTLIAAAFWMAALRGLHFENIRLGLGLIDDYWTSFYLMSYADGFRRRALIGSLFRLLQPSGAHVLLVNALALLVLGGLLSAFAIALLRIVRRPSPSRLILAFTFCTSTLLCVFFEVVGDLLQLCLVLFLLAAALSLRQRSIALKAVLGYALLLLCFFVHEASIFLLAPCLPFLLRRWPRWQDFVFPALAVFLLLAISFVWSDLHPHLTYHLVLLRHNTSHSLPVQTKPFAVLLREMYLVKFGGVMGKVRLAWKAVRILLLTLAAAVVMANLLRRRFLTRQLYVFAAISLFSMPLWAIGEDWGRFLAYNLLLATVVASWHYRLPRTLSSHQPGPAIEALTFRLRRLASLFFVQLAAIALLFLSPFHESRVLGITSASAFPCLGLILAAIAQTLGWIPNPLPRSIKPEPLLLP